MGESRVRTLARIGHGDLNKLAPSRLRLRSVSARSTMRLAKRARRDADEPIEVPRKVTLVGKSDRCRHA